MVGHFSALGMKRLIEFLAMFCKSVSWNFVKSFRIRVFLVSIFPHLDWIYGETLRRDTVYFSAFNPNAGKYELEKLRIQTLFTQCELVSVEIMCKKIIKNLIISFALHKLYIQVLITNTGMQFIIIFKTRQEAAAVEPTGTCSCDEDQFFPKRSDTSTLCW